MNFSFLSFSALVAFAAAAPASLYTMTPVGEVLSHCVHEVPNGASHFEQPDGSTLVSHPSGDFVIPKCDTRNGTLAVLRRSGTQIRDGPTPNPLPPDYDGWTQYTAYQDAEGFDSFVGEMSVPDEPKEKPQLLYLFPGLQNIDWIPKVDPEPTRANPFDIIQPVLQYPASGFGGGWGVKSWYVTVNAGALYSTQIKVEAGDIILCNMTRTGPQSWSISSVSKNTGKSTVQQGNNERLKSQPWAYNTVECYGCRNCETYPKKPLEFTNLKLYKKGVETKATWLANPKPAAKLECHEATKITDSATVSFSFQ